MDFLSTLAIEAAQKGMDGHTKRQMAISSNMANVDTPNYRRKHVEFEGALQSAINTRQGKMKAQYGNNEELPMQTASRQHLGGGDTGSVEDFEIEVLEDKGTAYRNDGNNVDVESEMAQLARNTERYLALANMQNRQLRSLKAAITNSGG